MTLSVQIIAQALQLPPTELVQRSLISFLEREIRAAQMDVADFQDRYGVRTVDELHVQIERGDVYSHPAWEDAIEWENLEAHLARLQSLLEAS